MTGSSERVPSVPPWKVLSLPGEELRPSCCSVVAWLVWLVATWAWASASRCSVSLLPGLSAATWPHAVASSLARLALA